MNNKYYLIACGVLIAQISIYAANNDGGGAITPRQQLIPRGRSGSVPNISKTIFVPLKQHGQGKIFDFAKPRQAMYQVESFILEEQRKKENHLKALVKKSQEVVDLKALVKEKQEMIDHSVSSVLANKAFQENVDLRKQVAQLMGALDEQGSTNAKLAGALTRALNLKQSPPPQPRQQQAWGLDLSPSRRQQGWRLESKSDDDEG